MAPDPTAIAYAVEALWLLLVLASVRSAFRAHRKGGVRHPPA